MQLTHNTAKAKRNCLKMSVLPDYSSSASISNNARQNKQQIIVLQSKQEQE